MQNIWNSQILFVYLCQEIKVMTVYLAIGLIFGFSIEVLSPSEEKWDNFTRIFVILLWPLAIIYVLREYLK